ncbi:MAG: type II toxin-antitoxin system HipA family toxin [Desulfobacterales bacterium]|nr:type II toxin-antitoxin system HipA family toxin [Desulfobacterales bacterium]
MPEPSPTSRLTVWIENTPAGILEGPDPYVFAYRPDLAASLAVSLTMPVRLQSWTDRALHPIFQMNLPEGAMLIAIRQAIAKIARTDDLSLLQILGGNQTGRNRFTSADPKPPQPPPPPEALDDILKYPDTQELFRDLMDRYLLQSGISGVQPKVMIDARDRTTLRSFSYIVKSWDSDYPDLAANEYFCMTAVKRSGLPTPEFYLSEDGRLFVMKRFDLAADGRNLGFEDMCVLQGAGTDGKYDSTCERVVKSINSFVSPQHRGAAREIFFQSLLLSVALRNGDGHLKNYGVIYDDPLSNDIRLAPVYDVVTTTAYIPRDIPALSLGGSKKWWNAAALRAFGVAHCGLSQGKIGRIFTAVTAAVIQTLGDVRHYAGEHPSFRDTAARMGAEWQKGLETLMD